MKEDGTISKNKDLPGIFYLYLSYLFSSILASSKTQKKKTVFFIGRKQNKKRLKRRFYTRFTYKDWYKSLYR